MKYLYSYVPYSIKNCNICLADLINSVGRIEAIFSEEEFVFFRQHLLFYKISLREIERIPFNEPEMVL